MRRRLTVPGLALAAVAAIFLFRPQPSLSYETFKNDGCKQCHSDFRVTGGGDLHDLHRYTIIINTNNSSCNLCHGGGTSFGDVRTNASSADANHSCNGCHVGDGLRAQHAGRVGPVDNLMCSDCHGTPSPVPENVAPPFYARTDVNAKNPCLATGTGGEDFNGDGKGLDNDGDGLYDQNDTDCSTAVQDRVWGKVKAIFRD